MEVSEGSIADENGIPQQDTGVDVKFGLWEWSEGRTFE
jgi:hypothetical protein